MLRLFSPGDLAADALGLGENEHRVIFRMFINTLVWGAIGLAIMVPVFA